MLCVRRRRRAFGIVRRQHGPVVLVCLGRAPAVSVFFSSSLRAAASSPFPPSLFRSPLSFQAKMFSDMQSASTRHCVAANPADVGRDFTSLIILDPTVYSSAELLLPHHHTTPGIKSYESKKTEENDGSAVQRAQRPTDRTKKKKKRQETFFFFSQPRQMK